MSMENGRKWARNFGLLAAGMALLAGWDYQAALVAPLRAKESEDLRDVANLNERIAAAQKTIAEIQAKESGAGRIRGELIRLQDDLPAGSAMVTLPGLVKVHFGRSGIAVGLMRLNTTRDEPGSPGYQRHFWSLALPIDDAGRNITKMLLAVADLDREHPFLKVLDFAIRPDPEHPGGSMASLNVSTLIRK